MSDPGQALTLVSCEKGKMILHEEVVKKVLESEEAKNRKVAIISIAGMFRKETFFLNFVLRYLKSKRDPGWIRPESGPLEGFDWNSNRDGVTSGITVWSEVFVVNEVAIVLIDTQGLFDRKNSTAEDTYIMVLSFLFSSFQILNHHEDLNSSDLKNFELFAKYGMALEIKSKNFKGFQNLMFLVRDWKHTSVHPYGLKDGNQSLDEMFETEMNEELRSAHETFKHCEKVDCFLMPYPGNDVAQNEKFSGEINQIDEEFLNHMKTLVEHLIDSVKPKKDLLHEELNGEQLLHVMKKYVEYINNQELPEPKSLLQLQLEILQNKIEKVCVSKYKNLMLYGTNDKLLNKTKMVELHKKCADEVIAEFDTLQAFENKEKIDTLKLEFSQLLKENKYMNYKTTMEKEVERNLLRIFEESKHSYNTFLSDQSTNLRFINRFIEVMLEHRRRAITAFEEETTFGDNDRIQELRESLNQWQMALLRGRVAEKCRCYYNDLMLDGTNDTLLNKMQMVELHMNCKTKVIAEFDRLAHIETEEQIKTLKSELSQLLEGTEYYIYHRTNMEENVETELLRIFEESKESYNTFLSDQSKKLYWIKSFIEKASEHRRRAITAFEEETIFGDNDRIQELRESLNQDMDRMYNEHLDAFIKKHEYQKWFFSTMGGITTSVSTGVATVAGAAAVASKATLLTIGAAVLAGTVGTTALVAGAATRGVVAVATSGLAFAIYTWIKKKIEYRRRRTENIVQ